MWPASLQIYLKAIESVYIRKEINSHRIGLEHQHGRRFIVLENQYPLAFKLSFFGDLEVKVWNGILDYRP